MEQKMNMLKKLSIITFFVLFIAQSPMAGNNENESKSLPLDDIRIFTEIFSR